MAYTTDTPTSPEGQLPSTLFDVINNNTNERVYTSRLPNWSTSSIRNIQANLSVKSSLPPSVHSDDTAQTPRTTTTTTTTADSTSRISTSSLVFDDAPLSHPSSTMPAFPSSSPTPTTITTATSTTISTLTSDDEDNDDNHPAELWCEFSSSTGCPFKFRATPPGIRYWIDHHLRSHYHSYHSSSSSQQHYGERRPGKFACWFCTRTWTCRTPDDLRHWETWYRTRMDHIAAHIVLEGRRCDEPGLWMDVDVMNHARDVGIVDEDEYRSVMPTPSGYTLVPLSRGARGRGGGDGDDNRPRLMVERPQMVICRPEDERRAIRRAQLAQRRG
jgi:hypothetical protein